MAFSLFSAKLSRSCRSIIVLTAVLALLFEIVLAQRTHREAADNGPRALGLLEFGAKGKAHLIPITIMVEGKFYDAGAYKASPVPIALESGIVYEAMRSGVSQGLFTISAALHGKTWEGAGTWQSEAEIQASAAKKKSRNSAKPVKQNDDQGGPPVLRRAGSSNLPSDDSGTHQKSADKTAPDNPKTPPSLSAGPASSSPSVAPVPSPSPQPSSSNDDDPDRPQLRRGATSAAEKEIKTPSSQPHSAKASDKAAIGPSPDLQVIPAISDAGGPDPRSYAFDMKPDEENKFRKTMLAIAAAEVNARASIAQPTTNRVSSHNGKPSKTSQPLFENVRLRAFDLSTSNEAVLVLTATAHLPSPAQSAVSYYITLVAREDIYAELHKALANVTDNQHLDVSPRLDFIDAVDVDGDGRGELLFHQVYDRGGAYVVYRVIGNQLWPLYQGAVL